MIFIVSNMSCHVDGFCRWSESSFENDGDEKDWDEEVFVLPGICSLLWEDEEVWCGWEDLSFGSGEVRSSCLLCSSFNVFSCNAVLTVYIVKLGQHLNTLLPYWLLQGLWYDMDITLSFAMSIFEVYLFQYANAVSYLSVLLWVNYIWLNYGNELIFYFMRCFWLW